MRALAAIAACLALLLPPVRATADEPVVVAVVVHPARNERLDRRDVGRIFLRMRRFWNDGSPIVPINLEADSPLRAIFTARALDLGPERLAAYWNEQYFHGIFPPTVLSSAAAVKRYVASDPHAIGYIDARDVDDTVHVALTLEE